MLLQKAKKPILSCACKLYFGNGRNVLRFDNIKGVHSLAYQLAEKNDIKHDFNWGKLMYGR